MRTATILFALMLLAPAVPAQTAKAQAPVPTMTATDIPLAVVQDAIKKGAAALKPGVTVSDRVFSLADIGKYNVAVAFLTRPGGTVGGDRVLSHDKITEIYYILRGSGTQVTGTLVDGTHSDTTGNSIGPGWSSNTPIKNGRSTKLGPGEMQIIPPGLGHSWSEIAPGGIDYLVFRVDPEHVLALTKE
jgi:mannose-6-phosphate isomerase-like protein (cupin superfamily)